MIHWNDLEATYNFYQQYYTQVVLPSFPQFDQIITCDEEIFHQLSGNNHFNDITVSQKMLSQLSTGLRTGNQKIIDTTFDWLNQTFQKIGNMHHLTAISLYHKISDIYIEFILQYNLSEKLALKIGLFKLYNHSFFQSWDELMNYYKKLTSILLEMVSFEEDTSCERTITQIKTFIHKNLHRNLTLTEIANAVNYNSTYISRLFPQMTGQNLFQYIMQEKISRAKEYLTQSNDSIQDIAEKLGFDTSQYFSSVFKKHTGFSPRDYRNRSIE